MTRWFIVRFTGFDSEKNHNLVEWCCDAAHQAYLKVAIGIEQDGWCIYAIPAFRDRRLLRYEDIAKNYIIPIKYCPFCAAPATDATL